MKNKEKMIALACVFLWMSCLQSAYGQRFVTNYWNSSAANKMRLANLGLDKQVFPEIKLEGHDSQAVQPVKQYSGGVARAIFGKPFQPELNSLEISYNQGPVSSLKDILVPKVTIKKSIDQESLDFAGDRTSNASDKKPIIVNPEQLRSYLQRMPSLDREQFVDMLLQQPAEKERIVWNADMTQSLKITPMVLKKALQLVEDAPFQQQDQSMDLVPALQKKGINTIDRDIRVISEGPLRGSSEQIAQAPTPAAKAGILTAIKNGFLRMLGFKVEDLSSGQSNEVNGIVMQAEDQIEAVDKSVQPAAVKQRKYSDIIANMLQAIKNLFVAKPVDLQL